MLLKDLGWVKLDVRVPVSELSGSKEEEEEEDAFVEVSQRGVTMISHSKYVLVVVGVDGVFWMSTKYLHFLLSSGSYTHAWMLKGHPELIGRSCFIDPVSFCSWEGGTSPILSLSFLFFMR